MTTGTLTTSGALVKRTVRKGAKLIVADPRRIELARLATEHRVDAVLVAGDVFDAQTVTERTLRRMMEVSGDHPNAAIASY